MKKVEIKGKLSLDKMTVANLDNTLSVTGGGFLSIGKKCREKNKSKCNSCQPK